MTTQTVPIIKLRMLRGACKPQRAIFKSEWPDGAEATLENVLRAVELGLSLDWARRLFTPTALAEYEQQVTPLRAEYQRQRGLLRAELDRQASTARDEYDRQEDTLWDEYQRQKATVWLAALLASQEGTS